MFLSSPSPLSVLLPLMYSLLILIDSSIRNRSLRVGLLSIPASFIQLWGYGSGFLAAFWKRLILKQKGEGFDSNAELYGPAEVKNEKVKSKE